MLLPAAPGARRSVLESYSFISGNSSYSGAFEAQVQIPQVQQAGNEGKGHGDYSNFEELPGCDLNFFTPQRNKRRERSAG